MGRMVAVTKRHYLSDEIRRSEKAPKLFSFSSCQGGRRKKTGQPEPRLRTTPSFNSLFKRSPQWDGMFFFPLKKKEVYNSKLYNFTKKYIEKIKHPNSPIVKKKWTPGRLRRFGEARQTRLSASQSLPASQPRTKLSLPIHPQLSSPPSPFSSPPNYISPSEKPLSHPLNPPSPCSETLCGSLAAPSRLPLPPAALLR